MPSKGIMSQLKDGASPLSWLPPGCRAGRTGKLPGEEVRCFPIPCVPWGGGRNDSTHTDTQKKKKGGGEKKEKICQ